MNISLIEQDYELIGKYEFLVGVSKDTLCIVNQDLQVGKVIILGSDMDCYIIAGETVDDILDAIIIAKDLINRGLNAGNLLKSLCVETSLEGVLSL